MTDGQRLQPILEDERIVHLDVIRGIAILFILFMNIQWMGSYAGPPTFEVRLPSFGPADWWTLLTLNSLLEGTQRGLLELLFGAGIMIMARRAMTGDGPVEVADLHYRRNLWLILFGLFNAFVLMWYGDILLLYGIAAIFLFPFRRLGVKGQLAVAAALLGTLFLLTVTDSRAAGAERAAVERIASRIAAGAIVGAEEQARVETQRLRDMRRAQGPTSDPGSAALIAEVRAASTGGFAAYWNASREGWTWIMTSFFWRIQAEIMATMLIGMALFRLGVIQGRARTRIYVGLLAAGYGIGLALRGSLWVERLSFQPGFHWQRQFDDLSRVAMTLGHLGLIHLLLRASLGRRLLAPFAAAGKIPLTIYLFTSFLMMWIVFAPWGLGMFGQWSAWQLAAVAALVIALELVAANFWVRRFANGPAEWLWKSLSYQQRQPFRRMRAVPATGALPTE